MRGSHLIVAAIARVQLTLQLALDGPQRHGEEHSDGAHDRRHDHADDDREDAEVVAPLRTATQTSALVARGTRESPGGGALTWGRGTRRRLLQLVGRGGRRRGRHTRSESSPTVGLLVTSSLQ